MTPLRKRRKHPLTGTVTVPGDKSVSHRALIIAALTPGKSTIEGLNGGDDVTRTRDALRFLGADIAGVDSSGRVKVEGSGRAGLGEPADVIDAGNSGSTARMLAGVCAALPALSVVTGDATLRARPMLRVVVPLRTMGAAIEGRAHGDRLPLTIRGGDLTGADLELSVASAQVKSAILFAGLHASGTTSVVEPRPSRDHTERMLAVAGIRLERDQTRVSIEGGQELRPVDWVVPGDISSAMYLLVAALLIEGSHLTVDGVSLNETRTHGLDVLRAMGAHIEVSDPYEASGDPAGSVTISSAELTATEVGPEPVARFIDEIPILAIAASQATGETVFHEVGELRTKESDRLSAIVEGLAAVGGNADVSGDRLVVRGPTRLAGGEIDSRGDHRIALAFAVAGLIADGPIRVRGWSSVNTSFPDFLEVLGSAQGGSS